MDETPRGIARDRIHSFSTAMLHEVVANDHKGLWNGADHERELDYHVAKLKAAVRAGEDETRVLEFAADVANCAWMWLDDLGVLDPGVITSRQLEPFYVPPTRAMWRRMPKKHLVRKWFRPCAWLRKLRG